MATITVFLSVDEPHAASALQQATGRIEGESGELVVDFSTVRRIDASGLRALEQFANAADAKAVKVVLRGVNVNLYKTLKLVKLAHRFSFAKHSEGS
ncbi:MAG TPA: STAS domain-containing protein [Candidatus Sulfotelmatobacter sp.]|nr:STAS domain-containing protein [Candidatus Sulfotelmatobacter sp.]